jgi:glutamine synthetase
MGTLDTVTKLVGELEGKIGELEGAIDHHGGGDLLAEAKHFQAKVIPAMKSVRDVADKLEGIVADDLWPLPTYREMLFIK